jgi:hypothetical protein
MARNLIRRRNDARELEIFRTMLKGVSVGVLAYKYNMTRQRVSVLVDRMARDMLAVPGQPKIPDGAYLNIRSMREWPEFWAGAANRYEPTVIPPTQQEEVA